MLIYFKYLKDRKLQNSILQRDPNYQFIDEQKIGTSAPVQGYKINFTTGIKILVPI